MSDTVTAWLVLALAALSFSAGYFFHKVIVLLGWMKQPSVHLTMRIDGAVERVQA